MSRHLASDWRRLRRLLGTRAGGVYAAGFALFMTHFFMLVAVGPGSLGDPSLSSNLIWLSLPAAALLVVAGAWFVRRNWLAWSIKRNLLVELFVLTPVVLLTTVVGRPESFSFTTRPIITALTMTFVALLGTLLLSVGVLSVRVLVGFVRGHPDEDDEDTATAPDATDAPATADDESA